MSKYFLIVLVTLIIRANGQVAKKQALKTTDWYSLISSFVPDGQMFEVPWEKTVSSKIPVRWTSVKPKLQDKLWLKKGEAKIRIDADGSDIKTNILAQGEGSKGYSSFSVFGYIPTIFEYKSDIKSLLGHSPFEAKLLHKKIADNDAPRDIFYAYELTLPGKKVVWLYVHQYWVGKMPNENGGSTPPSDALEITCYFDKSDYLAGKIEMDAFSSDENQEKQVKVFPQVTAPVEQNKLPVTEKQLSELTPMATLLFSNVKSRLSNAEKNEVVAKAGITPADTLAKTKKGKPKKVFTVYPTDINSDGTEDIFICITTSSLLGISENNYHFFTKDFYGNYQPTPGKIGNGVRVLMNGKSGYPDLITGAPGLNREIWSWNGGTYFLQQRISGNATIPYQTMDIDKASLGYTGTLNNPVKNAVLSIFNGEWYSPDYNYSFRVNGNSGVATLSNSQNYKVGDLMLLIKSFDGEYYHGTQIYTDGDWHDVTLKLKNKDEMIMKGGVEWIMIRKNN